MTIPRANRTDALAAHRSISENYLVGRSSGAQCDIDIGNAKATEQVSKETASGKSGKGVMLVPQNVSLITNRFLSVWDDRFHPQNNFGSFTMMPNLT